MTLDYFYGQSGELFAKEQKLKRGRYMAFARTEVKELEPMVKAGKKKFVRYQEGAELYSMGLHTFEELAKEAGAIYKIRRVVLVNLEIFEEYLDTFRM